MLWKRPVRIIYKLNVKGLIEARSRESAGF